MKPHPSRKSVILISSTHYTGGDVVFVDINRRSPLWNQNTWWAKFIGTSVISEKDRWGSLQYKLLLLEPWCKPGKWSLYYDWPPVNHYRGCERYGIPAALIAGSGWVLTCRHVFHLQGSYLCILTRDGGDCRCIGCWLISGRSHNRVIDFMHGLLRKPISGRKSMMVFLSVYDDGRQSF